MAVLGVLVFGCALPGSECGWVEHSSFATEPVPEGRCAKVRIVGKGGHLVHAPSDGCAADSADSCIILMPGDTAEAYTTDAPDNLVGTLPGERQNADLVDGACPLSCG